MQLSDIEIARNAKKMPISDIAQKIDIPHSQIIPYGHDKAKISSQFIKSISNNSNGKLILVTAINPTPAGEGKTTTTVGLTDGLAKIGKRVVAALREPSLGPCFGLKGGAAGGGHAQVVPMDDLNLHFTGDFHAITSAHNLLSAMIDNHIYWGNKLNLDLQQIRWKRALDMNDRALRDIVISLGGRANGYLRQTGFDITVASEVMAIFCLAENIEDLTKRLGQIVIGYTYDNQPVTASALRAEGAMAVLLKDALQPNLVQTLENNPVLVHGGPFANIAHGCNSVIATKTALKLADYVVTEAGFGADLGAEKFFDIKCRKAGLNPDATVIVATIRALKMNGGVEKIKLHLENLDALKKGTGNLLRHIGNMKKYGMPVIIAINHFHGDTEQEINTLINIVKCSGHEAVICKHWAEGGEGIIELAEKLVYLIDNTPSNFKLIYNDQATFIEKIDTIVREVYGGCQALYSERIRQQLKEWELAGYGNLPVCMAKTPYSFSADAALLGTPENFDIPIRDVRLCAGAGFIVVICGDIMTMPGLPRYPVAEKIHLNDNEMIMGLS